jgi:DNA primase
VIDADLNRDVIARVREAADLVDVAGEHVRLKKKGRTWEGLCPFHEEKTPSFSIDAEKGLYYCFGCHQGGDVFKFVMQLENLNFPEAVERLAHRYGVTLPPRSPQARERRDAGDRQRVLLDEAQAFFVSCLEEPRGVQARAELERRGFARESWPEVGFGFAPDEWRGLLDHLSRRHPEGALVEAGLAVRPDSGTSPYDRFRNRLTFPVRSGDGALIAFGGRILGDGEPKYLNSPETPIFRKRSTLFCLDRARRAIADLARVLVVEGYFDCLSLHRVGIAHAVATLGTALTTDHARLLKRRLGPEGMALLCYDADNAGRRAAASGAQTLLEAGVDVAVVVLPAGEDPDDVIRERGVEAFRAALDHPTPLLDFLLGELPPEPARRRRAGLQLAPLVCAAADAAVRQNLIEELARQLYLRPREVEEHGRRGSQRPPVAQQQTQPRRAVPAGERELVRIVVECSREWRRRIFEVVHLEYIEDARVRAVLEAARVADESAGADTDFVGALMQQTADPDLESLVAELCTAPMPEVTDETIRCQLRLLLNHQAKESARRLAPLIAEAETRGDLTELDRLLQEKAKLRQKSAEI